MPTKGPVVQKKGFWTRARDIFREEKADPNELRIAGKCYSEADDIARKAKEAENAKGKSFKKGAVKSAPSEKKSLRVPDELKPQRNQNPPPSTSDTVSHTSVTSYRNLAECGISEQQGSALEEGPKSLVEEGKEQLVDKVVNKETAWSLIRAGADKVHMTPVVDFMEGFGYLMWDMALGRRTRSTAIILAAAAVGATVGAVAGGVGALPGGIAGGIAAAVSIVFTGAGSGMTAGYVVSETVLKKETYSDLSTRHTVPLKKRFGISPKTANQIGAYLHNRGKRSWNDGLEKDLAGDFVNGLANADPKTQNFINIVKFLLTEVTRLTEEVKKDSWRAQQFLAKGNELKAAKEDLKRAPYFSTRRSVLKNKIAELEKDLIALDRTAQKELAYVENLIKQIAYETGPNNPENNGKAKLFGIEEELAYANGSKLRGDKQREVTEMAMREKEAAHKKETEVLHRTVHNKEEEITDKVLVKAVEVLIQEDRNLFKNEAQKIALPAEMMAPKGRIKTINAKTSGTIIVDCVMPGVDVRNIIRLVYNVNSVDGKNTIECISLDNLTYEQVNIAKGIGLSIQNNIETRLGLPLTKPERSASVYRSSVPGDNASETGSTHSRRSSVGSVSGATLSPAPTISTATAPTAAPTATAAATITTATDTLPTSTTVAMTGGDALKKPPSRPPIVNSFANQREKYFTMTTSMDAVIEGLIKRGVLTGDNKVYQVDGLMLSFSDDKGKCKITIHTSMDPHSLQTKIGNFLDTLSKAGIKAELATKGMVVKTPIVSDNVSKPVQECFNARKPKSDERKSLRV